jgi:D-alanyl-D-alanine carboxypeptidase
MKYFYVNLTFLLFSLNLAAQNPSEEKISKEFLLGKTAYTESDFVKVDSKHASRNMYLNRETYAAFKKMFTAAKADGIQLKIVSGARSFEHQKAIWDRKWKANEDLEPLCRSQKILEFSSMPATSRHHWGTDIDLNNLENSYFEEGSGKAEYEWLVKNASRFGFFQVYTSKDSGRTGYSEEKWHWSYLPLARHYLQAYNEMVSYKDIAGFEGAHLAEVQEMIAVYVNGISQEEPTSLTGNAETQTVFTEPGE